MRRYKPASGTPKKKPTPFPGSPPRGKRKRGKDGIDILISDKPRKGRGRVKGIGNLTSETMTPKKDKGKGRGKVTPILDTGKPGRRKKVPLPISPKRGIKIPLGSKPKTGGSSAKKATPRARQARRVG